MADYSVTTNRIRYSNDEMTTATVIIGVENDILDNKDDLDAFIKFATERRISSDFELSPIITPCIAIPPRTSANRSIIVTIRKLDCKYLGSTGYAEDEIKYDAVKAFEHLRTIMMAWEQSVINYIASIITFVSCPSADIYIAEPFDRETHIISIRKC